MKNNRHATVTWRGDRTNYTNLTNLLHNLLATYDIYAFGEAIAGAGRFNLRADEGTRHTVDIDRSVFIAVHDTADRRCGSRFRAVCVDAEETQVVSVVFAGGGDGEFLHARQRGLVHGIGTRHHLVCGRNVMDNAVNRIEATHKRTTLHTENLTGVSAAVMRDYSIV